MKLNQTSETERTIVLINITFICSPQLYIDSHITYIQYVTYSRIYQDYWTYLETLIIVFANQSLRVIPISHITESKAYLNAPLKDYGHLYFYHSLLSFIILSTSD